MQYREFGKIDFKPSALGFGAMRLPVLSDAEGRPEFKRIDYPAATAMLQRAIEGGVNYVDTAWMYHEDTCETCLLYTSPSPRDGLLSRMPSSA